MNYYEHFTKPMLDAIPSPDDIKNQIRQDIDKRITAKNLGWVTKLPAVNELGKPVLVANLSMMEDVGNYYDEIIKIRLRFLRRLIDDAEYYNFYDSLPQYSGKYARTP